MTIREHLRQIQRPYIPWAWGFGLLFGLGTVGLMIASSRKVSESYDPVWYLCVAGVPYLIGAVGLTAALLIPFFRIRCPQCHTAMRGQWKRWKHCPFCAAELDRAWGSDKAAGKSQDGASNGNQPIRSETNSHSSHAVNNPRALKVLIALLTAALLTSLVFLDRALWRNYWWEQEAYGLAGMVGTKQAMEDFRQGRLRLRAMQGENERLRYSGSNDGPFEIWIPQFYPSLGYPHRFSTELQVEFYNRKMRYMHEHPEKFGAASNTEAQKDRP